jgi:hypothetical protein
MAEQGRSFSPSGAAEPTHGDHVTAPGVGYPADAHAPPPRSRGIGVAAPELTYVTSQRVLDEASANPPEFHLNSTYTAITSNKEIAMHMKLYRIVPESSPEVIVAAPGHDEAVSIYVTSTAAASTIGHQFTIERFDTRVRGDWRPSMETMLSRGVSGIATYDQAGNWSVEPAS